MFPMHGYVPFNEYILCQLRCDEKVDLMMIVNNVLWRFEAIFKSHNPLTFHVLGIDDYVKQAVIFYQHIFFIENLDHGIYIKVR